MATVTPLGTVAAQATEASRAFPGVTANIGDLVVFAVACDNQGVAGVASLSSVLSDTAGNLWSLRLLLNRTGGAIGDGTTLGIWTARIANALSGGSITSSFSPNTTSKVLGAWRVRPGPGETIEFLDVAAGATGQTTSFSPGDRFVSTSQIIFGFTALEGNVAPIADSDTTDGAWSAAQEGVTSGSLSTGQSLSGQYKIPTADGPQTYSTTYVSNRDYATAWLVLAAWPEFDESQVELVDFFPPLGMGGGPNQLWPLGFGVDPLNLRGHKDRGYLLVAEPHDATSGVALGPFAPLGDPHWPDSAGEGEWGWKGRPATLHVAATVSRSSANDDTPAAQWVPGKLLPLNWAARLFDGVDPLARSRAGEGVIDLVDPDHGLDSLLSYAWDGAPITLRRGAPNARFASWEVVWRGRAAGLVYDMDTKQIRLRDGGWPLSGPLHAEAYAGTGDVEGDASLAGQWKPWTLGYCFNVEPVTLSVADQILQWSLGSSSSVIELRHGGVPLEFHADYPTYSALAAATDIPYGKYGTCLARSLVRPLIDIKGGTASREFGIRVDVIGDADTAWGRPAPTTRAAIARRIATTWGPNRLDDATGIEGSSFARMEAWHSAPVGWHFAQPISKADALDRVLAGILGWWRVRPDGQLVVGWTEAPVDGAGIRIAWRGEGMGKPRMVAWAPPRAGTRMSWRTNYAPQNREQLAGWVDEASIEIYRQEARYVTALSPAVSTMYPTAATVSIGESGFWLEVDAVLEATRQQGILEVPRTRWQWEQDVDPYADLLGSTVTVTEANVLGLGTSKSLIVVGIDAPGTPQTTLELWG